MDCSSVESWRLVMLRRLVSVLSKSWPVDAVPWTASSCEMTGEICPAPVWVSVSPSGALGLAGGVFLAISAGGFPLPFVPVEGCGVFFWAVLGWRLGLVFSGLADVLVAAAWSLGLFAAGGCVCVSAGVVVSGCDWSPDGSV